MPDELTAGLSSRYTSITGGGRDRKSFHAPNIDTRIRSREKNSREREKGEGGGGSKIGAKRERKDGQEFRRARGATWPNIN